MNNTKDRSQNMVLESDEVIREEKILAIFEQLYHIDISDWDGDAWEFADQVSQALGSSHMSAEARLAWIQEEFDIRARKAAEWFVTNEDEVHCINLKRKLGIK